MVVSDEVKSAITTIVKERFSDAKITSVTVAAGEASDGDPILNVYVVFEPEKGKETLDGAKMSGLPRRIMGKLSELDMDVFPLVSFVSSKDAKKLKLEAA